MISFIQKVMNRLGVSAPRVSRQGSRRFDNYYNMKSSAPNYGTSVPKNSYIPTTKTTNSSLRPTYRKNNMNYDYTNTPMRSLLRDNNGTYQDSTLERNRQSKIDLVSQIDSKKDSGKKQFRIRQNGTKDAVLSNSRKTEKQEEDREMERIQQRQKERNAIKMQQELQKQKQKLENERKLQLKYAAQKNTSSKENNSYKKYDESTLSTTTGGGSTEHKKSGITSYGTYSYSSSKTIGLVGLNNIGNTCFMNSILQCMFNIPGFNDYFLEDCHVKEMHSGARVAQAYARTIKTIRRSSSSSQTPSELKNAIGAKRSRFMGYAQQDAQQFLAALLELLSLDLNRAKNPKYKELTADTSKNSLKQISDQWWNYNKQREDSIVCDYFSGQVLSRVVCSRCGNQSIGFDNIWDMALNFSSRNGGDILKMIEDFLKEEIISSDYYCSKCKTFRECKRKIDFYRLPKILVFQLKRFEYGHWRKTKLNNCVKVETTLDLGGLVSKSEHPSVKNPVYDLVGVVNHSGGIDFGHYTAECKNPINGKWYNFNDSHVSETRMRQDFESSSPYVLFYAKRGN